jgi:hypothetical protein
MKLPDDIERYVYLNAKGVIVVQSVFEREHPGLMDDLQPFIEDNIFTNDGDDEEINWGAVEKDWDAEHAKAEEGKP